MSQKEKTISWIIITFFENLPLREVLNMSKLDKTHVLKKKLKYTNFYKHVKNNNNNTHSKLDSKSSN